MIIEPIPSTITDTELLSAAISPIEKTAPQSIEVPIHMISFKSLKAKNNTRAISTEAIITARMLSFFICEAFVTAIRGPPVAEILMSPNSSAVFSITLSSNAASSPFFPLSLLPNGELKNTAPILPPSRKICESSISEEDTALRERSLPKSGLKKSSGSYLRAGPTNAEEGNISICLSISRRSLIYEESESRESMRS